MKTGVFTAESIFSLLQITHDVSRIATILEDKQQLPVIYGLLFGMPGVPSIYYGSKWGIEGKKQGRDEEIRPRLEKPEWNKLSDHSCYARHTILTRLYTTVAMRIFL